MSEIPQDRFARGVIYVLFLILIILTVILLTIIITTI